MRNAALGVSPGDHALTERLIEVAIGVARHAASVGGHVHWEWPTNTALWNRQDVQKLLESIGAKAADVSTVAAGMSFAMKD